MRKFIAVLRGAEEVPPVRTRAFGITHLLVSRDKKRLFYVLKVRNIRRFTQAHIHLGPRGVNGPIVAFLFGFTTPGISVNKGVVSGTITADDLVGPLKGKTIADLVREMRRGNTYVNVHTEQNPDGEIRGQIRKLR
ncbi:CHRD domain-containing protein [Melghirimyces profundicolus]|uniref:CHRD domain-containing protein n=1 Tax=Melghirimyces profundicolus TaxID=1242148 RepID=A0A2T6AWE6_9BACL|nr:CHRD domain-containing protein [Melghirimyces profundicolus]PTX48137.1 CHRD domain-containing protein [Melghirimyces profundicolus]